MKTTKKWSKMLAVGMFSMVLVFGFFFVSCASDPAVTQSLYRDIRVETFSKFRFYISKDVQFTRIDTNVSADKKATRVKTSIDRNIINLKNSTTGRVQGNLTLEKLEIGFEKLKDGSIPTLAFVQKKGNGRYYFEEDTNGYIKYGNEYYTVTYKGTEEPYLLYKQDVKEKTKKRSVKGLN